MFNKQQLESRGNFGGGVNLSPPNLALSWVECFCTYCMGKRPPTPVLHLIGVDKNSCQVTTSKTRIKMALVFEQPQLHDFFNKIIPCLQQYFSHPPSKEQFSIYM